MKSFKPKLNLLVAYPYYTQGVHDLYAKHKEDIRLVIDSGAFTAWNAGKPIKLDDYLKFIDSLNPKPWRYFALDVVGDPKATMENYKEMLRQGFTPEPIFTRGADLSMLEEFYETSDLVGIGGLVGTRGNKAFVNGIMRQVKGRKVHLLGFTSMDYLKYWRPYMCDSSSWNYIIRGTGYTLYMGKGRRVAFNREIVRAAKDKVIERELLRCGLTWADLSKEEAWRKEAGKSTLALAAANAQHLALDVEKNLGVMQFSAASGAIEAQKLIDGFNIMRKHYE